MLRLTLLGGAVPLGLLTGFLAWLVAGGADVQAKALDAVEVSLAAVRAPTARGRTATASAVELLRTPLFALTTGPGAVREPAIRVDGISLSRQRTAALLSIDGKPADWLPVGQTRDGVTLQAVGPAGITVETAVGTKPVALGDQAAASTPLPGATAAAPPPQAALDRPPPGVRPPLEPANAPKVP